MAECSYKSLAGKGTLLVVDDDPAILKFLSGLLAEDLCVLTADSGEHALEQSRSFNGQIHLLLTDITMPNMNGIDLATQIVAQRPEIKVVLMSGFPGDVAPTREWHYIPKPFKPSQLIALIQSLISPPQLKFTAA
jgi:two-component system cell cycle sensor histidine kinase/response regulator CckA